MKHVITTIVGDFNVHLSYSPSSEDLTLNTLTKTINNFSTNPLLVVTGEHPELDTSRDAEKIHQLVIDSLDEAKLESALAASLRVAGGSGPRLTLSMKKREIEFTAW